MSLLLYQEDSDNVYEVKLHIYSTEHKVPIPIAAWAASGA